MNNYEAYFGTVENVYNTLRCMCTCSDCNDCIVRYTLGICEEDTDKLTLKEWLMTEIS